MIELVGLWSGGLGFDGSLGRPGVTAGFDGDERRSNQTVRLGYSFGDFSVSASTSIAGDTDAEFAVKYSSNGITVAAGADSSSGTNYALSGAYSANNFTVGAIYVDGPA